jgi:hypothetical protein
MRRAICLTLELIVGICVYALLLVHVEPTQSREREEREELEREGHQLSFGFRGDQNGSAGRHTGPTPEILEDSGTFIHPFFFDPACYTFHRGAWHRMYSMYSHDRASPHYSLFKGYCTFIHLPHKSIKLAFRPYLQV